jgi:hypothetical protein
MAGKTSGKIEVKGKFLLYLKEKIFIILGVAALIIGIILELMGYGAMVEGLIVSFGFFLIHAHVETLKEIRLGNDKIKESINGMKEDLRSNTDRIIEAMGRKKRVWKVR